MTFTAINLKASIPLVSTSDHKYRSSRCPSQGEYHNVTRRHVRSHFDHILEEYLHLLVSIKKFEARDWERKALGLVNPFQYHETQLQPRCKNLGNPLISHLNLKGFVSWPALPEYAQMKTTSNMYFCFTAFIIHFLGFFHSFLSIDIGVTQTRFGICHFFLT